MREPEWQAVISRILQLPGSPLVGQTGSHRIAQVTAAGCDHTASFFGAAADDWLRERDVAVPGLFRASAEIMWTTFWAR